MAPGTWLEEKGISKVQRRITEGGKKRRPKFWKGVGIEDGNHESEQTDAL